MDNKDTKDNREDNASENFAEDISIEKTPAMAEAMHFLSELQTRENKENKIEDETAEAPPKKMRFAEILFEWVEIFSSAFLTVILLFTFIFRMVTVEGPSMQETLHAKDNLIISHLFYTPKQNDIVVIQVPNSAFFTVPIIKRVIAIEGQTVNFDFDNWIVYVDGEPLAEPYVNYMDRYPMDRSSILPESLPITVEPGKIFVMGDNRNFSADSRNAAIGQVDVNNVVGRVMFRVFPFDKVGVVKAAHGE